MMLGARTGAWAKVGGGVPTARDYVQDGLIAMWDGIENAGWGVHDSNVSVWNDLSGNGNDLILKHLSYQWKDDCLGLNPVSVSDSVIPSNYRFIEVVYCLKEPGTDFVFGTSLKNKHFVLLDRDRGITFFDGADHQVQPSLHPQQSSLWVGLKFYASCAYDKNGLGVASRMFFNGENEYPTGLNSPWVAHPGIHNTGWRKNSELFAVRLYSRELTDSEVSTNYAVDKARFNLP